MNKNTSRREFLKTTLGTAAFLGFPSIIPASALGKDGAVAPSNRVHVAIIGCGNQSNTCRAYTQNPKAQIVAVCDPFLSRRQLRAQEWNVQDTYNDFREVLARKDIDAVHVVTGDHWHVPISLAAARAGKDVYCEKPLGLTIEEDKAAREITGKYNRVFQYGTQQRSSDACRMGLEIVLNGHIGEVKEIYAWAPRGSAGPEPQLGPVPEGFDYNMWLGPAPEAPYSPERVTNRGSWFIYDYSNGFIAGWGAHPLDILQWWADQSNLGIPVEYKTTGTIPDRGLFNTVTDWDMEAAYANGLRLRFQSIANALGPNSMFPPEHKQLAEKHSNGTLFIGTKGWVNVTRGVFTASTEEIRRKAKDPGPVKLPVSRSHMGNFVDCVISREEPISPLETGIRSDTISQLGNICIRTGEHLRWDPVAETIIGSDQAVAMMRRPMRAPWTLSADS